MVSGASAPVLKVQELIPLFSLIGSFLHSRHINISYKVIDTQSKLVLEEGICKRSELNRRLKKHPLGSAIASYKNLDYVENSLVFGDFIPYATNKVQYRRYGMHEQFMKYGSPPIKLIEECGELIQAICKGERFGYDDRNPLIENSPTCRQRVLDEIDDVENALKNFKSWLNELPEDIKREMQTDEQNKK